MTRARLRCAIYTRKSSEEGLDQTFNSLDAQREACEAYIKSQAGEGWTAVRPLYDDGGFSGGSMKRPALAALLADIEAGLIDVVVVYKVDRLTRSLTDFSRIVEAFDAKGVSFCSITQAFNTTTSMGRLTLNVLLSFAQFEREVTGERIRDKVAASKVKGMWMGGRPPLGYNNQDKALVINAAEAERVKVLFERYLVLGSVQALQAELDQQGALSKHWTSRAGVEQGGKPFSRGALFQLLKNPIYVGKVRHKSVLHPGLHARIVSDDVFEAAQAKLAENGVAHRDRPLRSAASWLKGKIFDGQGRPMSPSFGYGKSGEAFRYYVSAPPTAGRDLPGAVRRVSAQQIEELVLDRLGLTDPLAAQAIKLRVELHAEAIHLMAPQASLGAARRPEDQLFGAESNGRHRLVISVRPVFRGGRTWLMGPGGASPFSTAERDPALIKGLRSAHACAKRFGISATAPLEKHADASSPPDSYHRRLIKLTFLAPDIQAAILEGRLPPGVTAQSLMDADLPLDWKKQRAAVLGKFYADTAKF